MSSALSFGSFSQCGLLALATLLLVILPLGSCGNRTATASSPEPAPKVSRPRPQAPPPETVSEPQTVAKLPSPQPVPPEAVPETPGPLVSQPEEQASQAPETPAPRPASGSPPASTETATPPGTPAASVPALGQMLSVEQRKQYNQLIDQAMARVQELLVVVGANTSRLSDQQHTAVKRIQAFIKQAEEQRGQDLTIAKNLADRALTLAEDLAKSFK